MTSPSTNGHCVDTVTVVVCTYTEVRWPELHSAVSALQTQTRCPDEIVIVVDHNESLYRRAQDEWASALRVVANGQEQGLSGARNQGVAVATGSLVAFLDDDATPAADWLEHLVEPFADSRVVAVGGAADPRWTGERPRWLPWEFDWVVGCSYRGLPTATSEVRNVLGATMAFRRRVFDEGERFSTSVGRVGSGGAGCEETELCIRVRQRWPESRIVLQPQAHVSHLVPPARQRFGYFARRCFAEGISKAVVTDSVGSRDGLSSERSYATRTLPRGMVVESRAALRGRDPSGLVRAAVIAVGLGVTTAGYARGTSSRWRQRMSEKRVEQTVATEEPEFEPVRLLKLDLAHPDLDSLTHGSPGERSYNRARVLVRRHRRPVAAVDTRLENGRLTPAAVERIRTQLSLSEDNLGECECSSSDALPDGLRATVVVATRDRPADLRRCLDSVLATRYPELEVIVVDSAPGTPDAQTLVNAEYPQVRYVREEQPGLARAHNRALEHVSTPIVAFTDDDVVVDPDWLWSLVAPFATGGPEVGCVTGLIWPAELETAAQMAIENHGGFAKGFDERTYDLLGNRPDDPLFPYTAGRLGSGANMAFRTDVLLRVGGFDSLLGAGAPGRGGDDLAAFAEVVLAGYSLVYAPAAVVHHRHRRNPEAVRGQALNYGVGLSAYLTGLAIACPTVLVDFARLAPRALAYLVNGTPGTTEATGRRRDLLLLQLLGVALGPWLYLRGALAARSARK